MKAWLTDKLFGRFYAKGLMHGMIVGSNIENKRLKTALTQHASTGDYVELPRSTFEQIFDDSFLGNREEKV